MYYCYNIKFMQAFLIMNTAYKREMNISNIQFIY